MNSSTEAPVKFVWLSGDLVPESNARVSALDRGFLYGDGLFETMRVWRGRIPFWDRHAARLTEGLRLLRFKDRPDATGLQRRADELLRRNAVEEGVFRLQVTRGVGARGYSPRDAGGSTVLMSTHPLPRPVAGGLSCWRVVTAGVRVWSGSPLNRVKSTSKVLQVLARAEADDQGADEALLLNERGDLVEASGANLFWVHGGKLLTPSLEAGALPGVTRAEILRLARGLGLAVAEISAGPEALHQAEGVFLTNSVWGVVAVGELDGHRLPSCGWVARLWSAWLESLATGG
ncbi:MAG: aminotransferase class IV [Verrucomicrobiales bacterium]|nr:aminotransferase class IV [Verrucomicrobiales bacterium]